MLMLERTEEEQILLKLGDLEITIVLKKAIKRRARIGIKAPPEVKIIRVEDTRSGAAYCKK